MGDRGEGGQVEGRAEKILIWLFDSYVAPILEYACDVWMDGNYNEILERIQFRFLKLLLGVNVVLVM